MGTKLIELANRSVISAFCCLCVRERPVEASCVLLDEWKDVRIHRLTASRLPRCPSEGARVAHACGVLFVLEVVVCLGSD